MTAGANTRVRVATYDAAGQRMDLEEEFGAPPNPTTGGRRGVYDMPEIERPANTFQPRLAPEATLDDPVATGRADRVEPRHSGSYADDERAEDVLRPETLDVPSSTGRSAPPADAGMARAVGDDEPAADTPVSSGRSGQVQPRMSGEGVEEADADNTSTPESPRKETR
jgi:hypothetical protein